jgi:acyl-coenzyme A synthetase/AMP-(fatty) acid ligase
MRELPTTAEYIAARAAAQPRRPAFREDGRELSYAELDGIVAQAGLALQRLGIAPGARVAVSGPGLGIQLALLLAAESLGAVTVSFQAEADPDRGWLLANVDWVFSCVEQTVPEGVRFQYVDQAFAAALGQPLAGARPRWTALPPGAPQRMVRTSGSSGPSKFMLLSRQSQEWWIRLTQERHGSAMDGDSRYLMLSPLVINAGYTRASACLREGGMVMTGEGKEFASLAATHVTGLPLQMDAFLREVPAGTRASRPTWVTTFGGAPTPELRARVEAVFGDALRSAYGSNETGAVCHDLDAAGDGWVRAGVDVRVLDAQGQDLPQGASGILAIRTPAVPQGYLGRPEETAAAFRDGWFVSGDVGVLLAPRRLRLLGRHDALVNIAGLKVPALQLEQALVAQSTIADAAVVAVNLEQGATTLGVALVLRPGADRGEMQTQLQAVLQSFSVRQARVQVLPALPRSQADKVDRMALLQLFRS